MKHMPLLPRWARWTVPAAIVAATGSALAAAMIPSAAAAPPLPPRTPAQLLAALASSAPAQPLSGTVTETASPGLPTLPAAAGAADPTSLTSLLAGSHTIKVWYSDPAHYRLAVPQSMTEDDLIASGRSTWLWNSPANTVTHTALPASATPRPALPAPLTPQQAADQVLARVGPTTAVSVDSNVTVAGEAAYQLTLAPKSPGSLIGQVRIAVDAQHHVPLRLEVFAKHAASPAAEIGFTSIAFARPASSEYAFTPPAGAKVIQRSIGSTSTPVGREPGGATTNGISVIGGGWLAVAALPQSVLASPAATTPSGSAGSSDLLPFRHSSEMRAPGSGGAAGPGSPAPGAGAVPGAGPVSGAALNSAKQVSGAWGSGRLLRTSLVSVLVTNNGRVLVGAVTPEVLYQAATQAGRPLAGLRHTASQAAPR